MHSFSKLESQVINRLNSKKRGVSVKDAKGNHKSGDPLRNWGESVVDMLHGSPDYKGNAKVDPVSKPTPVKKVQAEKTNSPNNVVRKVDAKGNKSVFDMIGGKIYDLPGDGHTTTYNPKSNPAPTRSSQASKSSKGSSDTTVDPLTTPQSNTATSTDKANVHLDDGSDFENDDRRRRGPKARQALKSGNYGINI